MRWRTGRAKDCGADYIGDAETIPVRDAARELWEKYLADASPQNIEIGWDHLRVELWLDSGRIILFPAISPFRRRIEKSACQITCPDVLNFYETLLEAGLPDKDFESQLARKENEIVELLSTTAREAHLPERLGRSEVRMCYYSYEGESGPIKEDVLTKCHREQKK